MNKTRAFEICIGLPVTDLGLLQHLGYKQLSPAPVVNGEDYQIRRPDIIIVKSRHRTERRNQMTSVTNSIRESKQGFGTRGSSGIKPRQSISR